MCGAFAPKRSLLGKMPGEDWEQFANLRLLFTFMYAHPGKKLLFMGAELGQSSEWDHARGLEWRSLENNANRALGWFFQDLNRVYRSEPALFEADFKPVGSSGSRSTTPTGALSPSCARPRIRATRCCSRPTSRPCLAPTTASVSLIPSPTPCCSTATPSDMAGFAAEAPARVVRAEEVHWHDRDFSVIGAAMLVNTDIPAYRVSYSVIAGTAAVSAAFLILLVGYLWRAQKRKAVSGAEQLIGSEAVVLNWKHWEGYVWAQGERWSARGDHHFASGQKLKIRRRYGLTPSAQASTWGQTHADVERAPNGKASQCVSIGRRCGVRFSPILRPESSRRSSRPSFTRGWLTR